MRTVRVVAAMLLALVGAGAVYVGVPFRPGLALLLVLAIGIGALESREPSGGPRCRVDVEIA